MNQLAGSAVISKMANVVVKFERTKPKLPYHTVKVDEPRYGIHLDNRLSFYTDLCLWSEEWKIFDGLITYTRPTKRQVRKLKRKVRNYFKDNCTTIEFKVLKTRR